VTAEVCCNYFSVLASILHYSSFLFRAKNESNISRLTNKHTPDMQVRSLACTVASNTTVTGDLGDGNSVEGSG